MAPFSFSLLFSHRVPAGSTNASYFFANASEALSADGDVTAAAHKYSQLWNLEAYRGYTGLFEFWLTYPVDFATVPGAHSDPEFTYHWTQACVPCFAAFEMF